MKSTGIVRSFDTLGRLVVPKELRTERDLGEGSPVEIYTEGDLIILKPYLPSCVFCSEARGVKDYRGKRVCPSCINEMANIR